MQHLKWERSSATDKGYCNKELINGYKQRAIHTTEAIEEKYYVRNRIWAEKGALEIRWVAIKGVKTNRNQKCIYV